MIVKREDLERRMSKILETELLKIRFIQLGYGIPNSVFFRIIANIFRETGGNTENVFLVNLIREITAQERRKS